MQSGKDIMTSWDFPCFGDLQKLLLLPSAMQGYWRKFSALRGFATYHTTTPISRKTMCLASYEVGQLEYLVYTKREGAMSMEHDQTGLIWGLEQFFTKLK